jgi:hypothetical protein
MPSVHGKTWELLLRVMGPPYRLTKECWQILYRTASQGQEKLLQPQDDLQCPLGEYSWRAVGPMGNVLSSKLRGPLPLRLCVVGWQI